MATITSANSVFMLSVVPLFPVPQKLEGYSADDSFAVDAKETAETVFGIDGKLSAGYVFNPTNLTITIMPDSPSLNIFETWINAEAVAREKMVCNATVQLPAIGKKYTLTKGFLISHKPFADNKRTLQPMPFVIRFESAVGNPI
jgi:hypothetical protein